MNLIGFSLPHTLIRISTAFTVTVTKWIFSIKLSHDNVLTRYSPSSVLTLSTALVTWAWVMSSSHSVQMTVLAAPTLAPDPS